MKLPRNSGWVKTRATVLGQEIVEVLVERAELTRAVVHLTRSLESFFMSRIALCRKNAAVVMLLFTAELHAGGFRRGDSNQDSQVNLADATVTLEFLFVGNRELACTDAADADDSGEVDIVDPMATLFFLFGGGSEPPAPGPDTPGPDPTVDSLGCDSVETSMIFPPTVQAWMEWAPAVGTRQRQGNRLPENAGVFQIGEGISFVVVVEATENFTTLSDVPFESPTDSTVGNPASLLVTVDQDLGNPGAGGVAAGESLATRFLNDIDVWEDPIRLVKRAALRIDGASVIAPSVGTYAFSIRVTDASCSSSLTLPIMLEVFPSTEPEVHFWLEGDTGGSPDGTPLDANDGSGGLRLPSTGSSHLILEARPNSKASPLEGDAEIDTSSVQLFADWPILPDTVGGEALGDRITLLSQEADGSVRWSLLLTPDSGAPTVGNSRLSALIATNGGTVNSPVTRVLESEVSYANHVQSVWNDKCAACHDNFTATRGLVVVNLSLTASLIRRNIVNVFAAGPDFGSTAPLLVTPFTPQASYLYLKLTNAQLDPGVLGEGDQMPADGNVLNSDELHRVEGWIAQGAADN
jgi:hypothetical protein